LKIAVLIREKIVSVGTPMLSQNLKGLSELNTALSIDDSDYASMKEAAKLKAKILNTTIHVYYFGNNPYMLRSLLGFGADDAELIRINEGQNLFEMTKTVSEILVDQKYDLIMTGQQGAGANGVGPALSNLTGVTLINSLIGLEHVTNENYVATRTLGRGRRQKLAFQLPALMMCDQTMEHDGEPCLPHVLQTARIKIKEHTLTTQMRSDRMTLQTPSPRPKKIFMPDSNISAHTRLKQILSGGVKQRTVNRLEGDSKDVAQQFISFLKKVDVIKNSVN
jgi:electron transfer flavoprotein beta subunit